MTEADDNEARTEIRKALQLLTQDEGVQRENLDEELRGRLGLLWECWRIDTTRPTAAVQQTVADQLRTLVGQLVARAKPGGKPFSKEGHKRRYISVVEVSFNIASDYPKLYGWDITKRRTWLAFTAPKEMTVSASTAQRYVNDAIDQMAQLILDGGYRPVFADETQDSQPPSPSSEVEREPPDPKSEEAEEPEALPPPEPDPQEPQPTFTKAASAALSRTKWATPEDDALAVLAFSSGKWIAANWACEVLFHVWSDHEGMYLGLDTIRARDAMRLARKRGINRAQFELARKELAVSGALAIPSGRHDLVDSGLGPWRRPLGLSHSLRKLKENDVSIREFQRLCLDSGRLDLAGDWTDKAVQEHGKDIAERANIGITDGTSCAVLIDGLRRATLQQLVTAHPLALACIGYTAGIVFTYGTTDERLHMATWLLELIATSNWRELRGDSHRHISRLLHYLEEFVLSSRQPAVLADELAALVGPIASKPKFAGSDLLTQSRLT